MKNKTFLFVALVILVLIGIICWCKKCTPRPKGCGCYEEKTVSVYDSTGKKVLRKTVLRQPYECNDVLLNPNIGDATILREYLGDKGFAPAETCVCPDKLERWSYAGLGDVDIIDVVKNPPPGTGGIGGLALNYILPLPEPDSLAYVTIPDSLPNDNPTSTTPVSPLVKVAIVDSGVDISPPNTSITDDPQEYLFPFLRSATAQPCGILPAPFGLNVINKLAPTDLNGHGMHVNGIVAGFPSQSVSNVVSGGTVRLELINVKFTRDDTKSGNLFQAVCALYYALEQDAEVINISWGYLDDSIPRIMIPFLKEAQAKNVVIVAGLGNDTLSINGPIGSLRFWPAGFSGSEFLVSDGLDNVISVGASNITEDKMAVFSNQGDLNIMNVVAPGEKIVSTFPKYLQGTFPQSGVAVNSGTSMATPFVTRTVAMMIGKRKIVGTPYTAAEIKTQLINNANPNRASNVSPVYQYSPPAAVSSF